MAEDGRISPETIKSLEAQFTSSPQQKNALEGLIGMDVDPMLKDGLDEIEAIQIGGALARATKMQPNPVKFESLKEAYSAEITAGTVDPKDLEAISGLPDRGSKDQPKIQEQPAPNRRQNLRDQLKQGADAGELDASPAALVFVDPKSGETFQIGAAKTGELQTRTEQRDNKKDLAEITGHHSIPSLDDLG